MLKRLRRWHLDLAFFLGLAIFSWAYWYSKPRPVWTSYYTLKENSARNNNFTLLGYSADSHSIYTSCETTVVSKNWPIPQIQRWSRKTGELLEDYPVEFPEEDRFLLKLPRQHFGYSLSTTLCADPRYFMVRYEQSSREYHNYCRLYRIDGKPAGQGLEVPRTSLVEYLTDPTGGDRHWVTEFDSNINNTDMTLSVIDLDTGKPVRSSRIFDKGKMDTNPKFASGRYLYFISKSSDTTPLQMEIIDLHTGENLGCIQTLRLPHLVPLEHQTFAVCTTIDVLDSFTVRMNFYRFDSITKTLGPENSHPLDGLTSALSQWLMVEPPYLISVSRPMDRDNNPELVKVILGWLARIGLVRDSAHTAKFCIADWTTGHPLRQITGFPEQGEYKTAPDWCSIITHTSPNDKFDPGLALYVIPHYLWEPTLSWLQWLSWLLVIPWPLRYFLPQPTRAPGQSPSPSPDATADRPAA